MPVGRMPGYFHLQHIPWQKHSWPMEEAPIIVNVKNILLNVNTEVMTDGLQMLNMHTEEMFKKNTKTIIEYLQIDIKM